MSTRVLLGSTDSLLVYPPEPEQPTGATVRIRTPSTPLPDSGVAATVDSLSATTSADAAEGATALTLASAATFVRGRQYVVTAPTGEVFGVRCAKGGSSTTLLLTEPLPLAVGTGATVQGYALSVALSTTQTSQRGEGVARWTATFAGDATEVFDTPLRVVRRIVRPTLTSSRATTLYPLLHTLRDRADTDFTEALTSTWDRLLLPALEAHGIAEELIVSPEKLESAHASYLVAHLMRNDPAREAADRDYWDAQARDALETALASKQFWVDTSDEDDAVVPRVEDAPPAAYRSVRWTR